MINTVSKINLSKIGQEGGGSTSIWIMSVNILFFFWTLPLSNLTKHPELEYHLSHWLPNHNQHIKYFSLISSSTSQSIYQTRTSYTSWAIKQSLTTSHKNHPLSSLMETDWKMKFQGIRGPAVSILCQCISHLIQDLNLEKTWNTCFPVSIHNNTGLFLFGYYENNLFYSIKNQFPWESKLICIFSLNSS